MPRFVILEHDHPQLHWDLMLERDGALKTWRLLREPAETLSVAAESSFDHRLLYLDYEGPVSGNRGTVRQWDAGVFEWETEGPGSIVLRLAGRRVQGRATLTLIAEGRWEFFVTSAVMKEGQVDSRADGGQQRDPDQPK